MIYLPVGGRLARLLPERDLHAAGAAAALDSKGDLVGGAAGLHVRHRGAGLVRVARGDAEVAVRHVTGLLQLRDDRLGGVDRDREAHATVLSLAGPRRAV